MIKKEIYIIRHGQTVYNARGIVQGRGIDAPLNDTGQKQAHAFYQMYRHEGFEVVYTSTLLRAKQTVEPFIRDGLPHIATPDLDEISWGNAEGMAAFTDNSELFRSLLTEWKNGNIRHALPGGESPYDVQQRQLRFLDTLLQTPHRKVLVCTHGRYIRTLMCTMSRLPLTEMDTFEHTNLCLYKVNWLEGGDFQVVLRNHREHLAGIDS
ncbi:MAG: histidine phosphatase family protein [Chitinophagales bacterium]|nr:histidine phosphatase family protein [Chitinophagales bacterium]MDW8419888.1 histidine phosphatase family protein [Chitinophagales bacterium]